MGVDNYPLPMMQSYSRLLRTGIKGNARAYLGSANVVAGFSLGWYFFVCERDIDALLSMIVL